MQCRQKAQRNLPPQQRLGYSTRRSGRGAYLFILREAQYERTLTGSAVKENPRASCSGRVSLFGAWRSLVAHLTGGQVVAGSNPAVPTNSLSLDLRVSLYESIKYCLYSIYVLVNLTIPDCIQLY